MEEKERTIFERFFSIDEFKTSALVLILIVMIVAILICLFSHGTVPEPLVILAQSLIYAIAGVNAIGGLTSMIGNRFGNSTYGMYGTGTNTGMYNTTMPMITQVPNMTNTTTVNGIPTINPNTLPKI